MGQRAMDKLRETRESYKLLLSSLAFLFTPREAVSLQLDGIMVPRRINNILDSLVPYFFPLEQKWLVSL